MENGEAKKTRLLQLDYLRGYFVIVIIVDHLSRFPSAWQFVTGRGVLWATAAEGFVMISGLLIGYVRGLKNSNQKFLTIASKLLKRAVVLYFWMVVGSLTYVAATWQMSNYHHSMPWYKATEGEWSTVWHQVITMEVPHAWVYFLYLYTCFLLLSIPAVWLLRRQHAWLVAALSAVGYLYGQHAGVEWLKIQILFFIPAVAGYYLPQIKQWWQTNSLKNVLQIVIFTIAIATVGLSTAYTFFPANLPAASFVNSLFDGALFGFARVLVSALWFVALVLLFNKITPWLHKHTGGVVGYLGTHSLTAYIAHGLIILIIALAALPADKFLLNTLLGLAAVLGTYAFIRLPFVKKFIPS